VNVQVGSAIPEFVVDSVDPGKMKITAALLRDPNMIHLDPAVTEALGMGSRVVNQGPLNLGYIHTMLAAWAGGDECVLSSRFRFHGNVLAGDRVIAGGRVTAVRADGAVECEVWLDVTGGSRVVSGTAVVRPRRA
jgi:acyl dehydratase